MCWLFRVTEIDCILRFKKERGGRENFYTCLKEREREEEFV